MKAAKAPRNKWTCHNHARFGTHHSRSPRGNEGTPTRSTSADPWSIPNLAYWQNDSTKALVATGHDRACASSLRTTAPRWQRAHIRLLQLAPPPHGLQKNIRKVGIPECPADAASQPAPGPLSARRPPKGRGHRVSGSSNYTTQREPSPCLVISVFTPPRATARTVRLGTQPCSLTPPPSASQSHLKGPTERSLSYCGRTNVTSAIR